MRIHNSTTAIQAILLAGSDENTRGYNKPGNDPAPSVDDLDVRLKRLGAEIERARLALKRRP